MTVRSNNTKPMKTHFYEDHTHFTTLRSRLFKHTLSVPDILPYYHEISKISKVGAYRF